MKRDTIELEVDAETAKRFRVTGQPVREAAAAYLRKLTQPERARQLVVTARLSDLLDDIAARFTERD